MVNNFSIPEHTNHFDLQRPHGNITIVYRGKHHKCTRKTERRNRKFIACSPQRLDEASANDVCPKPVTDMLSDATLPMRHVYVRTTPDGCRPMKNGRRWHNSVKVKQFNTVRWLMSIQTRRRNINTHALRGTVRRRGDNKTEIMWSHEGDFKETRWFSASRDHYRFESAAGRRNSRKLVETTT